MGQDRRINSTTTDRASSAKHRTEIQHTNSPHKTKHATTAERRAISRELADQKTNTTGDLERGKQVDEVVFVSPIVITVKDNKSVKTA